MNLAFCLFKYFPYGGLQRDFLRIASLCQQRGHSITVYTQLWEGEIPEGFDVNVLPLRSYSSHGKCQEFARLMLARLHTAAFDKVIGFNKMPGLDIYYAADPCYQQRIRETRGMLYRLTPRYRTFLALEKAVFSRSAQTRILLLAANQQSVFTHYYHTADRRFMELPPGISNDRIAPDNICEIRTKIRREFSIADNDNLVLMIGSGYRRKGLDRTLRAIASLPENILKKTRLIVLGEDTPQPFLKLAKNLDIEKQVYLLGGRDDVPRFLLGADILVHPARSELAGMVLLEALCAGLPVLVTEVCGYAFHIERARAGMIIPDPFQQMEMNRLLCDMLTSTQHATWRHNARKYAQNTDLYSMPEAVVKLIEA